MMAAVDVDISDQIRIHADGAVLSVAASDVVEFVGLFQKCECGLFAKPVLDTPTVNAVDSEPQT